MRLWILRDVAVSYNARTRLIAFCLKISIDCLFGHSQKVMLDGSKQARVSVKLAHFGMICIQVNNCLTSHVCSEGCGFWRYDDSCTSFWFAFDNTDILEILYVGTEVLQGIQRQVTAFSE